MIFALFCITIGLNSYSSHNHVPVARLDNHGKQYMDWNHLHNPVQHEVYMNRESKLIEQSQMTQDDD